MLQSRGPWLLGHAIQTQSNPDGEHTPVSVCVQVVIKEDGSLNLDWSGDLKTELEIRAQVWRDLHALGETVYKMAEGTSVSQAGVRELEAWLEVRTTHTAAGRLL